ncbi:RNA helicase [Sarracenia purpurea var. burkii]
MQSASFDSTVKLWDAELGKLICSLNGHRNGATKAARKTGYGRIPSVLVLLPTRELATQRFALAVAEFNGPLYAVGGYDGKDYLKSAERFDPREHSWTRIEVNMNLLHTHFHRIGSHESSVTLH